MAQNNDQVFQIQLAKNGRVIASRALMANTLRARMVGLLGRSGLSQGEALVFPRCTAIHTIGMRFAIDVIFIDRAWRVVAVRSGLVPGRLAVAAGKAWGVIEAAADVIQRAQIEVGDQLEISHDKANTQC